MAKKVMKFQAVANPAYAAAMRELRRSSAAGTHADKREKRSRTRDAQKRKAMKDYE